MKLSEAAEEVAGFYARMLDHDYTTKEVFNRNFFNDWRKVGNIWKANWMTVLSLNNMLCMDLLCMKYDLDLENTLNASWLKPNKRDGCAHEKCYSCWLLDAVDGQM